MTDTLPTRELTPLCVLARAHVTDKGGWHSRLWTCHNYTKTYNDLFKDRREQVTDVLEIGIGDGASLHMWSDYFPNALIVGLDNNVRRLINGARIVSLHCDQEYIHQLKLPAGSKFDLIVDDGSHKSAHQISSANFLRDYLKPDGIYAIEDIHYDCRPRTILDHITWGTWEAVDVGIGLGGAHCECGCKGGEVLLIGRLCQ